MSKQWKLTKNLSCGQNIIRKSHKYYYESLYHIVRIGHKYHHESLRHIVEISYEYSNRSLCHCYCHKMYRVENKSYLGQ